MPTEVNDYESALLWKSLRRLRSHLAATTELGGNHVDVLTVPRRDLPDVAAAPDAP